MEFSIWKDHLSLLIMLNYHSKVILHFYCLHNASLIAFVSSTIIYNSTDLIISCMIVIILLVCLGIILFCVVNASFCVYSGSSLTWAWTSCRRNSALRLPKSASSSSPRTTWLLVLIYQNSIVNSVPHQLPHFESNPWLLLLILSITSLTWFVDLASLGSVSIATSTWCHFWVCRRVRSLHCWCYSQFENSFFHGQSTTSNITLAFLLVLSTEVYSSDLENLQPVHDNSLHPWGILL